MFFCAVTCSTAGEKEPKPRAGNDFVGIRILVGA